MSTLPKVLISRADYQIGGCCTSSQNSSTVVVEFDSLAQAISAYDSPGYQAALAVLGNAAERDLRIVEGVDG